jgi:Fe-S-cluster-containing dehydrogenase component
MAAKWNLIVDVDRCDNCRACFIAVKDEHAGNDFPGYAAAQPAQGHNWLDIQRKERGTYPLVEAHFLPVMCNHCDDAPCMKAARDGAVRKRDDGIVIIDPEKAKGQRQIVDACPYGAVEDAEMQRIKASEGLEVLKPELGTQPRVYYRNLHLITHCFVGGTVVADVGGVEECASGAQVVLRQGGRELGRATTDTFGEFKIDRLEPGSGRYQLEVSGPGGRAALEFDLGADSLYLGVLKLAAASQAA